MALWRKIQDHPFYKEKRVFSKYEAWLDILINVQHQEESRDVVIGMKVYKCHYGESLKSVKTWSLRWGWTESKVRRFLTLLEDMNQIRTKNEKKTTRLSVINYNSYDPKRRRSEGQTDAKKNNSETQEDSEKNEPKTDEETEGVLQINSGSSPAERRANDEQATETRRAFDEHSTTDKNGKNGKNVNKDIPDKIFSLKKRYSNQGLIEQAFSALKSCRKTGKIADSVLLAQLEKWDRYPASQVERGVATYLDKDCAGDGKDESYLLGIIRNSKNANKGAKHDGFSSQEYTGTNMSDIEWANGN